MKTSRPDAPLTCKGDGNHYHKSYLRHVAGRWEPKNQTEAKAFLEECMSSAQSLASIFAAYCWANPASGEDLKFGLEVIDDLLDLGYSMIEWWQDEAEFLKDGGTPPEGQEVQP